MEVKNFMKNDVLFSLSSDVSDDDYSIDLSEDVDLQIKEFLNANSSAGSVTLLQRAGTRTISSLTMSVDVLQTTFDSPLECFVKHQVDFADRPNGTLIINGTPILSEQDLTMLFTMTEILPTDFFVVSVVVNGEVHSVCMNCNAAKTPRFLKDLFIALNAPRKSSITYKKFSGPATDSVSAFFILVWDENKSLAEIFIDGDDESSELFNAVLRGYRTKHLKYALVDLADSTPKVSFYLSLAGKQKAPYSLNAREDIDEQIDYYISDVDGPTQLRLVQQVDGSTVSFVTAPVFNGECLNKSPLKLLLRHQHFYTNFPSGTLLINDTVVDSEYTLNSVVESHEDSRPSLESVVVSVIVNGVSYSVCQLWDADYSQEFLESLFAQLQSPRKKSVVYQTFNDEYLSQLVFAFILVWNSKGVLEKVTLRAKIQQENFDRMVIDCCAQSPDYDLINLDSQSQPQPQSTPSNLVFEVDDYPCDSSEDIDCALKSLNYGDSFSLHVVDPSGREVNCDFTVNEITGLFLASSLKAMSQPIPKSVVYLAFVPKDKLKNPMCSCVFVLVWNEQCTLQSCWFANDILYSDVAKYLDDTQYLYRDYTKYCFGTEMYDSIIAMHQNKSAVDRSANAPISLGNTLATGKLDEKLSPSEPTPPESGLISITPSELFGNNTVNNTSPRKQDDSINLQVHYLVNDEKSVSCAEPFTSVEDFVTALKSVAEESKALAVHCGLSSSIASETLQNLLEGFLEIFAQIKTPSKFTTIFNCFTKLAVKLQSNNFMLVNLDVAVKCCHAIFKIPNYEESYVVLENSLVMLKCPSEVSRELIADVAIALQNNGYIISRSDEFSTVVMWPINPSVSRFKDFLFTFKTTSGVSVEGVQLFNVFCNGVRVRTLATPREIERFLNSLVNQHYTLQSISALPSEFAKQFNRIHNGYVKFIPE